MTERTIRSLAKELAGAFYDNRRSESFREGAKLVNAFRVDRDPQTGLEREVKVKIPFHVAYPNARSYIAAWWPFYVQLARQQLVAMLTMSDARISAHMKECIASALIEDRENEMRNGGGRHLLQRVEEPENVSEV